MKTMSVNLWLICSFQARQAPDSCLVALVCVRRLQHLLRISAYVLSGWDFNSESLPMFCPMMDVPFSIWSGPCVYGACRFVLGKNLYQKKISLLLLASSRGCLLQLGFVPWPLRCLNPLLSEKRRDVVSHQDVHPSQAKSLTPSNEPKHLQLHKCMY